VLGTEDALGGNEKCWFCSDLYLSGHENLASLKIIAIIMLFCTLLGLSLRIMIDFQGGVIITST